MNAVFPRFVACRRNDAAFDSASATTTGLPRSSGRSSNSPTRKRPSCHVENGPPSLPPIARRAAHAWLEKSREDPACPSATLPPSCAHLGSAGGTENGFVEVPSMNRKFARRDRAYAMELRWKIAKFRYDIISPSSRRTPSLVSSSDPALFTTFFRGHNEYGNLSKVQ